jgi:hypothetical protein
MLEARYQCEQCEGRSSKYVDRESSMAASVKCAGCGGVAKLREWIDPLGNEPKPVLGPLYAGDLVQWGVIAAIAIISSVAAMFGWK